MSDLFDEMYPAERGVEIRNEARGRRTRVEFDTTEHRWSHGVAPRGRGSWAFGVNQRDPEPELILWSPGSMTLSDAKAWVKRELRTNGHPLVMSDDDFTVLVVLP